MWSACGIIANCTVNFWSRSTAISFVLDCDKMFVSAPGSPTNGTFIAPQMETYSNTHCIYTWIAQQGERVELRFNRFNLRGTPPE